ncbi:MAG: S8 family serine peptidase [Akkermansiaceae bacterium]|nr:S8 family serine peptidase [Akkermansiaceae bacterium]
MILLTVAISIAALLGWWLARDVRESTDPGREEQRSEPVPVTRQFDPENAASKIADRPPRRPRLGLEDALFGIPNERLVRFKTDADYADFLRRLAASEARLLGKLDQFRTVRVGFDDLEDLYGLLDDEGEFFGNFLVAIPDLPEVGAQAGALPFYTNTLAWLGFTGDNSNWGEGVRVAILDTGLAEHSAFPNPIPQIDLLEDGAEVPLHGHGTAVTSLIAGNHSVSPGIAPRTEVISIRIGDETGSSNSFLLAEGITRAVDEGAQIINISMGSYGDSIIVQEAVDYARANGVLLVAAAGNEGLDIPAFPAAYEGVISVGAVDAKGDHLDFSNAGDSLSLSAPGYSLNAAWLDEQFVLFTGTSASAPVVTAAIAATISEMGVSVPEAADLVLSYLNEAGAPGPDPAFGGGILDIGRVMNSNTAGIYDAALASNYFQPAAGEDAVDRIFVTVQNRGTETLSNLQINITLPEGTYPRTVGTLRPGDVVTVDRPVTIRPDTASLSVKSSVDIPGNLRDAKPDNDALGTEIILIEPEPPAEDPPEE